MRSINPLKAVREHCIWCCNGSVHEVALCPVKACPLWAFRFGRRPDLHIAEQGNTSLHPLELPITADQFHAEGRSALKAIRRRCLDCSGGSRDDAKSCTFGSEHKAAPCSLHPFRYGKNPNIKLTQEAREALLMRLKKAPEPV